MAIISELLNFRRDLFFEGAVQADWYYDSQKRHKPAESFVFHGPEYFGVTKEDIQFKAHELIDTCSFTEYIAKKLYQDDESNPLVLGIAGYGTGKSHLALTLATVFGMEPGCENLTKKIINNIEISSKDAARYLKNTINKPNLVIVLNGMRDFNFNYEILSAARKSLKAHGIHDEFLKTITRAYEIAAHFVERNFELLSEKFTLIAESKGIFSVQLKEHILSNIDSNPDIFELVNEVYKSINDNYIRWDDGISAGDILTKLNETVCGDRGYFNKILILFDEFGRYIEYASEYPTRAGEAAIQQVFEAVQNNDRQIIFVGFIQADLKTYLARVSNSSNIQRYVGRYESSDKIHLSSNLETIFANLLEKKDKILFDKFVVQNQNKENEINRWRNFHNDLLEWIPNSRHHGVWREWDVFKKVILEGTYPLHPLTTYILANLSSWLQQRSSLSFVGSEFDKFVNKEIKELGSLPYIYPINLIKTDFFKELLLAEEEGRQQSEYCIQYNSLLRKYSDKLSQNDNDVLAAILILKIGRFKTKTIEDVTRGISYTSGLDELKINIAISVLEDEFGILSFDETAGVFDFIEDATGANDFKRFISKKRTSTTIDSNLFFNDEKLKLLLDLSTISTAFSSRHLVHTNEWKFTQEIVDITSFNEKFIDLLIKEWKLSNSPEKVKGKVVWIYINDNHDRDELDRIFILLKLKLDEESPIVFMLLYDKENHLYLSLIDYYIIYQLTVEEKAKYARFIVNFGEKNGTALQKQFSLIQTKREKVTGNGVEILEKRLSHYCDNIFDEIYHRIVPFTFEGFKSDKISAAKKLLITMGRNVLSGLINYQWLQAQSKDLRNRIDSTLFGNHPGSWGVIANINDKIQLVLPTNPKVRYIFEELDIIIESKEEILCKNIFEKYLQPPYGFNELSLSLLLAVYMAFKGAELKVSVANEKVKSNDWANLVFGDKEIDYKLIDQTVFSKVNVDAYLGKFLAICTKIERNNDTTKCSGYLAELEKLEKEEDVPVELKDKVESTKLFLSEGIRLNQKVTRLIGEIKYQLSSGIKELKFKEIISVITSCKSSYKIFEESNRYVINHEHMEDFEKLEASARKFIEENFKEWISTVKCENITEVNGFDKWLSYIISDLKEIGFLNYARLAQTKLELILNNLDMIKNLQIARESLVKFLQLCKPDQYTNYEQLLSWKKEAETIKEYINGNKIINDNDKREYITKLSQKSGVLDTIIEGINTQITMIYDKAADLKSLKDCRELTKDIRYLLQKSLRPIDRDGIELIGDYTQDFLNDYESFEKLTLISRNEISIELDRLKIKWKNATDEIFIDDVLDDYKQSKFEELDELERRWVTRYLRLTHEIIEEYSSSDCIKWLKETEFLPEYLEERSTKKHQLIANEIKNRLNSLQVEAVVSMFDSLSAGQKEICLKLLNIRLKSIS